MNFIGKLRKQLPFFDYLKGVIGMFEKLRRFFVKEKTQKVENKRDVAVSVTEEEKSYTFEGRLKLQVMGDGNPVKYEHGGYYGTFRVCWVSEGTDEQGAPKFIRESEETIKAYPAMMPFKAAGKSYGRIQQLCGEDVSDGIHIDVHGREVLCYKERFPCFDSYDYLYEHRYYRWFFLCEHGNLTRIYTKDESGWIYVTEDVENIECKCVELLKEYGWIK